MIKTEFEYTLRNGDNVLVRASCLQVDDFGPTRLRWNLIRENEDETFYLSTKERDEIRDLAYSFLLDAKYEIV